MFGMSFFNELNAGGGPAGVPRPFKTQYRCYSVSMLPGNERDDLEHGGKIIMPPSALDQLTRLNIVYPMLFKLTNPTSDRTTHCGVLEFVADEGKVYIPYWMMQNLALDEGGLLQVESASLPVATFAKFQPHSVDFLDLTNPKAVLESRLRNFACLSSGDVVAITYNNKVYEMSVLETKPASAVSVIECDLNVDFAAPVGYQEPRANTSQGSPSGGKKTNSGANRETGSGGGGGKNDDEDDDDLAKPMDVSELMMGSRTQGFVPFSGSGNRLDGKVRNGSSSSSSNMNSSTDSAGADASLVTNDVRVRQNAGTVEYVRGIPDYDYEVGTLRFIRNPIPKKSVKNGEASSASAVGAVGVGNGNFEAFQGKGHSLRHSSTNKDRK